MRKFESSQKDESRVQSTDSVKDCKKRKAFNCLGHNTIWKRTLIYGNTAFQFIVIANI